MTLTRRTPCIYVSVLRTEGWIFVLCIRLLPDGSLYFVSLAAKRAVVYLCVLGCKMNTFRCYGHMYRLLMFRCLGTALADQITTKKNTSYFSVENRLSSELCKHKFWMHTTIPGGPCRMAKECTASVFRVKQTEDSRTQNTVIPRLTSDSDNEFFG